MEISCEQYQKQESELSSVLRARNSEITRPMPDWCLHEKAETNVLKSEVSMAGNMSNKFEGALNAQIDYLTKAGRKVEEQRDEMSSEPSKCRTNSPGWKTTSTSRRGMNYKTHWMRSTVAPRRTMRRKVMIMADDAQDSTPKAAAPTTAMKISLESPEERLKLSKCHHGRTSTDWRLGRVE